MISCFQILYGVPMFNTPHYSFSERWMMWPCYTAKLFASNSRNVNASTSFWLISPDSLTFPHPAISPCIPLPNIFEYTYIEHVHQEGDRIYSIGCLGEWGTMVTNCTGPYCALTSSAMARKLQLTYILLVKFVFTLLLAFTLSSDWQVNLKYDGRLLSQFGVYNFCIAHTNLAHAQTNYHVSHFGDRIHKTADR